MQYGVCIGPEKARLAAKAGYSFIECSVGGLLHPREDREAFQAALGGVHGCPLPCPVVNCFVPGDLKITGPDVSMESLRVYVTETCRRAGEAGVEIIVFGSGGARRIPEGFDANEAHDQLVGFCAMVGPIAQSHDVTVVVEPLNLGECNVLNTVQECADLVREVGHPRVRLLADAYHMLKDGDSFDAVAGNIDLIKHVHIATIPSRLAPGAEPSDFEPFFAALAKGGYSGRLSIEAKLGDPETELPRALEVMKAFEKNAGSRVV